MDEISSTERLLEVIRDKGSSAGDNFVPDTARSREPVSPAQSHRRGAGSKRRVTVGVDMGHDQIRLVKVVGRPESKQELLDYRLTPIRADIQRGTPAFSSFLRNELISFCGNDKNPRIWTIMPQRLVDVRHIRIPKVPANQLENTVYWTLKKEAPIDLKDTILDFEEQGEVLDQGAAKLSVMSYTVPRRDVREIEELFSDAGFPLTGISIPSFAIQNIFRSGLIKDAVGVSAFLFIGNDFSRIDIYKSGILALTRDIKAGTNSMIESLAEDYNSRTNKTPQAGKVMDIESARKIFVSLQPDAGGTSTAMEGFGLSREDVFGMVLPAVERLVRQVERTFEYYALNTGNQKVERIYISGVFNAYRLLAKYVSEQLGVESKAFELDNLRISSSKVIPSLSGRVAFIPALALALSAANAPNLMVTYKDREKEASIFRINRWVFTVFVTAVVTSSFFYGYMWQAAIKKKNIVAGLRGELEKYKPVIDKGYILKLASELDVKQGVSVQYGRRYLGMAVIREVSNITPSEIRLTKLDVETQKADNPKGDIPKNGQGQKILSIDGVIPGDMTSAEETLSAYVMKLANSPLFSGLEVQKKDPISAGKETGIVFTIRMKAG